MNLWCAQKREMSQKSARKRQEVLKCVKSSSYLNHIMSPEKLLWTAINAFDFQRGQKPFYYSFRLCRHECSKMLSIDSLMLIVTNQGHSVCAKICQGLNRIYIAYRQKIQIQYPEWARMKEEGGAAALKEKKRCIRVLEDYSLFPKSIYNIWHRQFTHMLCTHFSH